ncbi:MAG: hypothetical protein ACI4D8_08995 [Wujia sp.]
MDSQDKEKDAISEIPTIIADLEEHKTEVHSSDEHKSEDKVVSDTENNADVNTDSKADSDTNSTENIDTQEKIHEDEIEIAVDDSNLLGDGSEDTETDEFGFEIIE